MKSKTIIQKIIDLGKKRYHFRHHHSSNDNGWQFFGRESDLRQFEREASEILMDNPLYYNDNPVTAIFSSAANSQNGSAYVNICGATEEELTADSVFQNGVLKQ